VDKGGGERSILFSATPRARPPSVVVFQKLQLLRRFVVPECPFSVSFLGKILNRPITGPTSVSSDRGQHFDEVNAFHSDGRSRRAT